MKLVKMIGLAAIAAAAFSALLGAGSASAANEHPLAWYCKAQELLLCAKGNQYSTTEIEKGSLSATQIGTGVFEGGLFTEECTGGSAKAKLGTTMVDNIGGTEESQITGGKIETFTFTGCSPCTTVTVNGLPLAATVKMTGATGTWFLKSAGSATFSKCPFGATCKFGNGEINAIVEMTATESIINTNSTKLKLEEGSEFLCGAEGIWKAKFGTKFTPEGGTAKGLWLYLLNSLA